MFDIFIFKVDFTETYPRQVLKIAFKLENFLVEDTPRPPYNAPAFGTRDNALPPPYCVLGRQPLIINSAIKKQASSNFDFRLQMTVFYCFL